MRIDYCPKCNKAGLRDTKPDEWKRNFLEDGTKLKWCPRCKELVTPINKPYIGVSGRP